MRSFVAACALLLAAGSLVGASEPAAGRDPAPASVIAQFSQPIPPEPPVVAELPGQPSMAAGAQCCRMKTTQARASGSAAREACSCCRKSAAPKAKTR